MSISVFLTPSLAMKNSLLVVLVLSMLGLSHVSAQSSTSNILGPLIVGGIAGWGLNHIVKKNRRQDAFNDAMLAQSFGFRDPRFGGFPGGVGGLPGGFGGLSGGFGRPGIGHQRMIGYGRPGIW